MQWSDTCAMSSVRLPTIGIKYTEDSIDNDWVQGRVQTNVCCTPKLI